MADGSIGRFTAHTGEVKALPFLSRLRVFVSVHPRRAQALEGLTRCTHMRSRWNVCDVRFSPCVDGVPGRGTRCSDSSGPNPCRVQRTGAWALCSCPVSRGWREAFRRYGGETDSSSLRRVWLALITSRHRPGVSLGTSMPSSCGSCVSTWRTNSASYRSRDGCRSGTTSRGSWTTSSSCASLWAMTSCRICRRWISETAPSITCSTSTSG